MCDMSDVRLFDRDLSWLSFNYRVLLEAQSKSVPLLERLRFLAIYSSNLDEFFRVRVASIKRLVDVKKKKIEKHLDFDPETTLDAIHQQVENQLEEYGQTLRELISELKKEGVFIHLGTKEEDHQKELSRYFKTHIAAYLQPKSISKEKLFLKNKALYLGIALEWEGGTEYHMLNIPSDKLPRFYSLQNDGESHFYFLDDIIRWNLGLLFPGKKVLECRSFKLNKDADLQIDDEFSGNLVEKIEKQVKKRDLGVPSRFLIDGNMSEELLEVFKSNSEIEPDDISYGGTYHNLNDLFQIGAGGRKHLEYEELIPIRNSEIDEFDTVFEAIESRDQILHFPYQSYEYVLQFFNEAAIHPEVTEINVTFFRMAKDSRIGEALISAAKNGKNVQVLWK
jgi:polyphosphate kinase